jgi:hypothetical protein
MTRAARESVRPPVAISSTRWGRHHRGSHNNHFPLRNGNAIVTRAAQYTSDRDARSRSCGSGTGGAIEAG